MGVCAPAGPVEGRDLERGVAELESLGFRVRLGDGVLERVGFTAGAPERRLQDLHALFADDEIAGIVCARGGAGAGRLLASLDADLLRAHPKLFVGYSDITFLHLFVGRLGWVSFHGPMVARELASGVYDRASFLHALTGEGGAYSSELTPLRSGVAEGRLRGGCLSILAAAAGTRWAPESDAEGTLLFLEDVDEPGYRLDRMLLQLREAGALRGVAGIVFGEMKGCGPEPEADYSLETVLLQALDGLDIPVAFGLASGHTTHTNVTLPLGARACLECGATARFSVLEPGVR